MNETEPANIESDADLEVHPKPRYDDVNIPVIAMLAVFSGIMTFVIICFLQGLISQWNEMIVQKDWASRELTPQEEVIQSQKSVRNGFYEDGDQVYVSVDFAAEKLIERVASKESDSESDQDQLDTQKGGDPKSEKAKESDSEQGDHQGDDKQDSESDQQPERQQNKPEPPEPPQQKSVDSELEGEDNASDQSDDSEETDEKSSEKENSN